MDANNHGNPSADSFLPTADLEHPLQDVNHHHAQLQVPVQQAAHLQVSAQPVATVQVPVQPVVQQQQQIQQQAQQQPQQHIHQQQANHPQQVQQVQHQQVPTQSPQQQMQVHHQPLPQQPTQQQAQQLAQQQQQPQVQQQQQQPVATALDMVVSEAAAPRDVPLPNPPPPTAYPPRAALEVAAALMLDYRALLLKYKESLPQDGQEILDALEERGRRGIGAVVSGEVGPVAVAVATENGAHKQLRQQQPSTPMALPPPPAAGLFFANTPLAAAQLPPMGAYIPQEHLLQMQQQLQRAAPGQRGFGSPGQSPQTTPVRGSSAGSTPRQQVGHPYGGTPYTPEQRDEHGRFKASGRKDKVCGNCGSTDSPSWRRCPERRKRLHGQDRPFSRREDGSVKVMRMSVVDGYTCANCETDSTPLWRRGANGDTLCNACGLFYKQHGYYRRVIIGGAQNGDGGQQQQQQQGVPQAAGQVDVDQAAHALNQAAHAAHAAQQAAWANGALHHHVGGSSKQHEIPGQLENHLMGRGLSPDAGEEEEEDDAGLGEDGEGVPRPAKRRRGQSQVARGADAQTITFTYPFPLPINPPHRTPLVAYTWNQIQAVLGGNNKSQWCNVIPATRGKPKPFFCLLNLKDHPQLPQYVNVLKDGAGNGAAGGQGPKPNNAVYKSEAEWREVFGGRGRMAEGVVPGAGQPAVPVFVAARVGGRGGTNGSNGTPSSVGKGSRSWWVFIGWCSLGDTTPDGERVALLREEEGRTGKVVCGLECVERVRRGGGGEELNEIGGGEEGEGEEGEEGGEDGEEGLGGGAGKGKGKKRGRGE
ncbi:Trans-acting T-cell-specific transcription factor GATA-3 [Rhizophlyctis rosea]|nr:Trans-acting T-cell-specific transcription factor GATA-3 [Rhizophlyctis rosea]